MSRYAESTSVSTEKSKAEIETTLIRYGASHFVSGWEPGQAKIGFCIRDRRVRFILPLPDRNDKAFTQTPARGTRRSEPEAHRAWEQACRQRWRALALCIKAKLEAVAAGITTFDDEFMAHIVLSNGETVSEWLVPQLEAMPHHMPKLLTADIQ